MSIPVTLLATEAYDREAMIGRRREREGASKRDVDRRAAILATTGPQISCREMRQSNCLEARGITIAFDGCAVEVDVIEETVQLVHFQSWRQ